ncbi:MAG: methylated-DNA--[protein]-cysteine S-methyltransferase [Verrucomicrobiia bacterium]
MHWTVPLDLSTGTTFQQSVWRALRTIPRGETRSYGWVAQQIGKPRSSRAVGVACGANPIPVVVPCHRVIAGDGSIGGFGGGLPMKQRLLQIEGVRL